jgi:hypothetical protein
MLRLTAVAALLAVSLPRPLAAQMSELQPGARIRVQAPGIVAGRYEGTVLTRTADTIVVGGPNVSPVRVPLARVSSLEISRGNSRAEGAIAGMKWGVPIMAGFGVVIGAAAASDDNTCLGCSEIGSGDVVAVTALFALSGAIYGAGIGALIGRERWDQFDLAPRTSLRIQSGRIGLGLEFGF